MTKAPVVTAKIKTVNFKDDSCTTTEDATYTESGIENESRLDQEVENLDDKVEYNLYFDAYGWLRAYELANGNTYTMPSLSLMYSMSMELNSRTVSPLLV